MSMVWQTLQRLVVVAGHAIYVAGDPWDDQSWALESFQLGEPPFFVHQILRSVEVAAEDRLAGCIYSGGKTREAAGPLSEGVGYWRIGQSVRWLGRPDVGDRTATEDFARDSFENLLFGLCRFRELSGHFPEHITVVSWRFKEARFALHRDAIGWPETRWTYLGVNDPVELEKATSGERKTFESFRRDPYGRTGTLAKKRQRRNPFHQHHPYSMTCPEIADLLSHDGPHPFGSSLPWKPGS